MKTLFIEQVCPACKVAGYVFVDMPSSFICQDYVDIPAVCANCNEELHVTYNFSSCTID